MEEVGVEADLDMRGGVVAGFRTVVVEGEPIVVERC